MTPEENFSNNIERIVQNFERFTYSKLDEQINTTLTSEIEPGGDQLSLTYSQA